MTWSCLEGGWWDSVLRNADTGKVIRTDGNGTATTWGAQRDNGRASAGKYTAAEGWQLSTRAANSSPRGTNAENGLRAWGNGTYNLQAQTSVPGNAFNMFFSPNLYTQSCGVNIAAPLTGNGFAVNTSGARICGGTKDRPGLVADVFGDYREELVLGSSGAPYQIRVYFNAQPSTHKLATLMADRRYQSELQRQKSCYGQPVNPGYYFGADMNLSIYFESIKPLTDKSALAGLVASAEGLVEEDWSVDSWAVFEEALAEAIAVLEDDFAPQNKIDGAYETLKDAISALAVDKTALEELIGDAAAFKEEDWSVASWAAFKEALDAAIAVFEDDAATQKQVDDAFEALEAAVDALAVDKTALEVLIGIAEGFDSEDWAPASWAVLEEALEAAIEVFEDEDATQKQVDDACAALDEAISALAVDKDALEELIGIASLITFEDYTTASFDALCDALDAAIAVFEDEAATQKQVNDAWAALDGAIAGLEPKKLVDIGLAAYVFQYPGNKNDLYITLTEFFCNGTINVIEAKFTIDNNAEGTYNVGGHLVFVNTKGNVQIRELYVVKVKP